MKTSCLDIECAVAEYFSPRVNLIVPNISWGMGIHECDLLVVTKAGYCYEVEIKVSKSDLIADLNKCHHHKSKLVKKLYFAMPQNLDNCLDFVPANAGVLLVCDRNKCKCVRDPLIMDAPKITEAQRFQIARLGTMRIFTLKEKIRKMVNHD